MSRSIEVKIIGDSAGLQREFAKASKSTQGFTRDVEKSGRGALAASGAFKSLGRSVAFASSSFIGGAGLIEVMKASFNAGEELRVSQERLRTTMSNLGIGFRAHAREIDRALSASEKLSAFTKQDLTDNLNKLLPATKNVAAGLKDLSLATDIARARHIDLATATMIVLKAQEGQVGLLRRLGIAIQPVKDAQNALTDSHKHFTTEVKAEAKQLDALATSHRALAQLAQTYKGNAEHDTTATQRFKDETHQLEVVLGDALIPQVSNLEQNLTPMIDKWVKSGAAARDFKSAAHDLGVVLHDVKTVVHDVDKVTGGFKQTLELLLALKFAPVVAGWTTKMKEFAGVTALGAADSEAKGLLGSLTRLKNLGPIAIAVALSIIPKAKGSSNPDALSNSGGGKFLSGLPILGGLNSQLIRAGDWIDQRLGLESGGNGKGGMTAQQIINQAARQGINIQTGLKTDISKGRAKLIDAALGMIGTPYAWGGSGPGGFDCSGLVMWALAQQGVNIPHNSVAQFNSSLGAPVSRQNLKAGDVVYGPGSDGTLSRPGHEAMYVGNGMVVEAPQTGKNVRTISLNDWIQYAGGYSGARDFLGGGGTITQTSIDAHHATIQDLLALGTTKAKKTHLPSGIRLLPNDIRIALSRAAGTKSLTDDRAALERAIKDLQGEDSGKNKVAVEAELGNLRKALNGVDKQIADQVKARAAALKTAIANVKSSFAPQISAAQSQLGTAFQALVGDVDAQFQTATQAHITALGKAFFQNGLQTPLEAKLAGMQAGDTAQGLQDALESAKKQLGLDQNGSPLQTILDVATGKRSQIFSGAGTDEQVAADQKAVEQAQRAIDENKLAIDAVAERTKADTDYADTVNTYTAERTFQERQLTDTLSVFGQGLQDGSRHIGDINEVLAPFGISLKSIPADQLAYDMGNLSTATGALAGVMIAEARALAALGDSKDAQDIINKWGGSLTTGSPTVYEQQLAKLGFSQEQAVNIDAGIGAALLARIPHMAKGGIVSSPTLALIGEKGREAIVPLDSRGGPGGVIENHFTVELDGRIIWQGVKSHAIRDTRFNVRTGVN